MMKYGLSNLRRLRHVEPVELRPITLLVGKNSSGKSTFLRTLPLFRQSINTRTSSPILWYGDLVDFGSFDVSVSSDNKHEPVIFSFTIDSLPISSNRHAHFLQGIDVDKRTVHSIKFDIYIVPHERRTRISRVVLNIENPKLHIDIKFDNNNKLIALYINGSEATDLLAGYTTTLSPGALFPDLRIFVQGADPVRPDRSAFWLASLEEFSKAAFKLLRGPLDARIADRTLNTFITKIFFRLSLTNADLRDLASGVSSPIFKSFIREMSNNDIMNLRQKLSNIVTIAAMPTIFETIALHLKSIFSSTLYIGPARARSERYYRYQDLAVSEIDPDGKNFPMFLNSLTRSQQRSLSTWIEKLFGYGVQIDQQSGHISINLIQGESESNIVDVGYGVSQILPVLGQIWWARARPRAYSRSTPVGLLAIEQPELHLHPAHQALLADALVGETAVVANASAISERITFLVETHSETLVNRLGELVGEGKISHNEIQILLFEPDVEADGVTNVRSVQFDSEGVLMNWPYGFFQPEI